MKQLVDVVNFNADASCLSSGRWLEILSGGDGSLLVQWLRLYVDHGKKVVLGFPGATIADIAMHNPEAIALINGNPEIFEIILRPFAHDIALLRIGMGFQVNVDYGHRTIEREFSNVTEFFLPPEFMLTSEQIVHLAELDIDGVFINPARFTEEIRGRIPTVPYRIRGVFGVEVGCIPFQGKLTNSYLSALQLLDPSGWNDGIRKSASDIVFTWRDGESSFFLPDGLMREGAWLASEDRQCRRQHLRPLDIGFRSNQSLDDQCYRSYPVHSFSAWMKEFRMLGFINRVQRIEEELDTMTAEQVRHWMLIINSDIMSAIEKRSPVVRLKEKADSNAARDLTIRRSERGFEGEEYLALLEDLKGNGLHSAYADSSQEPHWLKCRGRMQYLSKLDSDSANAR